MNKSKIDYCRLPSIPCSKRSGNADAYFPEEDKYCTLFNPDQVHKIFTNNSQINNTNIGEYKICYKDYPEEGRPGDYTCSVNTEGRCVGQPLDCNALLAKQKKYKKKQDEDKGRVPNEIKCLPPDVQDCPKSRECFTCRNKEPKVMINSQPFYQCQQQGTRQDPMCISNVYTGNQYGLPVSQNTSNPPDNNLLYRQTFQPMISNKKIISCPKGYKHTVINNEDMCKQKTVVNLGKESDVCMPVENIKLNSDYPQCFYGKEGVYVDRAPKKNEFKTEKQCLTWCANNPDCRAMVKFLDRNGQLQCRYYKYDTKTNKIVMSQVKDETAQIYNKREFSYVADPPKKDKQIYDFNMIMINYKTKRPEGSMLDGSAPDGCCADGIRKEQKENNKNCKPFTQKSKLVGDPNDKYQYSSLGGLKMDSIDSLSGNAYINY